jgi:hypothetical protein
MAILVREVWAMTGTPKDIHAAVRERTEKRRGSIPAPDGLLPPMLWGTGLLTCTPVTEAEADREAKSPGQ